MGIKIGIEICNVHAPIVRAAIMNVTYHLYHLPKDNRACNEEAIYTSYECKVLNTRHASLCILFQNALSV